MINFPDLKELKYLRNKLGISQEELAKKLDLTQSTVSRIENEEIDPPYSKVKRIFEFLEKERIRRKKIEKKAKNLMTTSLITINSKSTIKEAVELMNKYNISQLPIIDDNRNIGSINSKKIQKSIIDNPELINAEIEIIKELPFPEVEKNWSIKDISNLLLNYPAVLVREYNKYIGIITDADLLKFT